MVRSPSHTMPALHRRGENLNSHRKHHLRCAVLGGLHSGTPCDTSLLGTVDALNLPDAEFDAVMTDIDKTLRAKSEELEGREIHAFSEYCARFKIGITHDSPTAKRICEWMDRVYGDRIRVDFDLGKSVVLLQGVLYRMRCLRGFGKCIVTCAPEMLGAPPWVDRPADEYESSTPLSNES